MVGRRRALLAKASTSPGHRRFPLAPRISAPYPPFVSFRKERMPGLRHRSMVEVNEFLVLDFIRERGDTTRPEIARELAMSAASVSRLVHRLRESGLIQESEGSAGGAGRPRSRISFNPGAGAVVAVDLGGTRCHGALADLGGSILAEDVRPTREGSSAYATLRRGINRLPAESAQRGLPVAAIAIGVPPIVHAPTRRA